MEEWHSRLSKLFAVWTLFTSWVHKLSSTNINVGPKSLRLDKINIKRLYNFRPQIGGYRTLQTAALYVPAHYAKLPVPSRAP